MNNILHIGQPYLDRANAKVRLCSDIECYGETKTVFYEFEERFEQYICWERSDPFFLALFQYAMLKKLDIVCDAPITEDLFFQITKYYIPVLSKSIESFSHISVSASTGFRVSLLKRGVGTGFSCGVDSFYTVMSAISEKSQRHKLTYLLFANVNALTFDYDTSLQLFEEKSNLYRDIAIELGLEFVSVNTNLLIFHKELLDQRITSVSSACKTCSCVFALQKMTNIYYFSSSDSINKFELCEQDPTLYDLFTLKELSIENLTFYSSGVEEFSRLGKVREIYSNDVVKRNLCVCSGLNCGRCAKCLRTQLELYALGVLDEFSAVFNVSDFKQHLSHRLGKLFSYPAEWEDGYIQEALKSAKDNEIKIPISSYLLGFFFYFPAGVIHRALRNNGMYRKIYYGKGLDVRIAGKEAANRNRPKNL